MTHWTKEALKYDLSWSKRFSLSKHPIYKNLNLDFIDPELFDQLTDKLKRNFSFVYGFKGKWDKHNTIKVAIRKTASGYMDDFADDAMEIYVALYAAPNLDKNFLVEGTIKYDVPNHDSNLYANGIVGRETRAVTIERVFLEIETLANDLMIKC